MKERPILFSAPMVRALLDGSKTQTRRVVKPRDLAWMDEHQGLREANNATRCPYGQPGDRLWVRETHAPQADCWGSWERWLRGAGGEAPILHYAADFKPFQNDNGFVIRKPFIEKWRPSIHMPRWASRIDLEVTGVRVERLQDIGESDCYAEGIRHADVWGDGTAVGFYRTLWEQINGAGSWAANPWVWVIEFRRIAS
jgi:hypothetical protein